MANTAILLFLTVVGMTSPAASGQSLDDDLSDEIEREIERAERTPYRTRSRGRTLVRRPVVSPRPAPQSFLRFAPVAGYSYSGWGNASPSGGRMEPVGGFIGGMAVLLGRDRLNYETGLQYVERGSIYRGSLKNVYGNYVSGDGATIETATQYLEVPVFLRFNVVQASEAQLFVRGGTTFAVLLANDSQINRGSSGMITYSGAVDVNEVSREKTLGVDLSPTDWRWAFGLGGNVKLSDSVSLTIDCLYERSVVEIGRAGEEEAYTSGVAFRTGVIFDL